MCKIFELLDRLAVWLVLRSLSRQGELVREELPKGPQGEERPPNVIGARDGRQDRYWRDRGN